MIKSHRLFIHILAFLFFSNSWSWAHSLRMDGYSSATTSQAGVDGTITVPSTPTKEDLIFDFDLGAAKSHSKTTNTDTTENSLGFAVTTPTWWSFRAGFLASRNPDENLNTAEPSISVAKKLYYSETGKKEDGSSAFDPFVKLSLKGSRSYMIQTSATSRSTAVFSLQQGSASLGIFWQPLENWTFELRGTSYNYNRDIKALYGLLGSYPYLTQLSSRLSTINDTISSLPESSSSLSVGYILNSDWDFTLEYQRTRDLISGLYGTSSKLSLQWAFLSSWSLQFGVGNTVQSDTNEKSNLSELSLAYYF